jgi:acetylornithine deacetylase/succinyl-diaminopimelate desuccinylase-like protein
MESSPQIETSGLYPAVAEEVRRLSGLPEVRSAFDLFRSRAAQFDNWQMEVAGIPAPSFGEAARGAWLVDRFRELGLADVHVDEVGNVFGLHGNDGRPTSGGQQSPPCLVALSAHTDTVFPDSTPLNIYQQGSKLYGPGVSDNGCGIVAMLAVASVIQTAKIPHALPFVFIGNVGEEGEGDLRGMRHVFRTPRWRDAIVYNIIVDGAGCDTVVAEALGSRRFEVIVRGPGGHSWSDFGAPNPIFVLARAVDLFRQTPVPASPKTTFNVGVMRGGTSVNVIPESASIKVDLRSTSMAEIDRLEHALRIAVDQAVDSERLAVTERALRRPHSLESELVVIGNRPAGELSPDARILKVIKAVDAQLGNTAQIQRASTDANIPLSLGREAIALGGGGSGGGAHTLQEWFDRSGRELGLKRILLTMLALAGVGE